jgi:hypothetical protein
MAAQAANERMVSGSVIRSQIEQLRKAGLYEQALERVAPEARKYLEKPPLSLARIPPLTEYEIWRVIGETKGAQGAKDMGYQLMGEPMGLLIRPILKSILAMMGSTPHSLYSNLPTITAAAATNQTFVYEKKGPTNGTLSITVPTAPGSEWFFFAWEGMLAFAFELCQVKGEVWPHETKDDGRTAIFRIKWEEKAK